MRWNSRHHVSKDEVAMSGSHFGYAYLEVFEFVEVLAGELNSSECNAEVTPEVRKVLEKMLPEFRKMAELMKLCKKLFSGDCGSQSFLERVNEVQGRQGDMEGICKELLWQLNHNTPSDYCWDLKQRAKALISSSEGGGEFTKTEAKCPDNYSAKEVVAWEDGYKAGVTLMGDLYKD